MENKNITELNEMLKGEQMAVQSYERYLEAVQDEEVKREFCCFLSDHKHHIDLISGHIQALGGKPDYGTGFAGLMTGVKNAVKNAAGRSTLEVIKEAYNGEDKGIGMTEEVVKGDLDPESMKLVKNILATDHDHLKRMMQLIGRYEGKQS
jgi:bacterioferritin